VGVSGSASVPDPRLVSAVAMVFVDDPAHPRLDAVDLHHLLDVRRLRAGERVVATDGAGLWVPCRLALGDDGDEGADGSVVGYRGARGDRTLGLVAEGPVEHQERPAPCVTVAFAPAKGDRPEWVVQKLTELGVDRIVIVRTARTVVRWDGDRAERAADRLRRVAREAAAQSRRPWLPEVQGPVGLEDLVDLVGTAFALARPGGEPPSLDLPAVVVGPEGGWDESERDRFPRSVGLGPTVLRAETAAVAAGALLCALRAGVVKPLA
jgi:16S rRNA (uracil1498-N3)-methyltransferase